MSDREWQIVVTLLAMRLANRRVWCGCTQSVERILEGLRALPVTP